MSFPNQLDQVESLIRSHSEINEEPLVLALYFAADQASDDVDVLEVLDGFGYNEITEDNDLFQVQYASTNGFRLTNSALLHLILTNPLEFRHAIDNKWPRVRSIGQAIKNGRYRTVYANDVGQQLLTALEESAVAQ